MKYIKFYLDTLRKKCPYSEFFFSVFSRIWTEYGGLLRRFTSVSVPSIQMENVSYNLIKSSKNLCLTVSLKNHYLEQKPKKRFENLIHLDPILLLTETS